MIISNKAEFEGEIKENWQIFKFDYIKGGSGSVAKGKSSFPKKGERTGRPLDFMGFKFYRDKTTLRRNVMLKATRKARAISKKKNVSWFDAAQFISYLGWFKHSDSHTLYEKHIRPYTNITTCKKVISKHSRKRSEK